MKIVLKRRLMNELLTTYLPTILILIIVYITNFFKTFFFEAVVTVNLTALLVLTTHFVSVSGSLPPTAYVKMVDLWLIFAQMIPFFEVLILLVDGIPSWVGFAIPEIVSSPGIILAAVFDIMRSSPYHPSP